MSASAKECVEEDGIVDHLLCEEIKKKWTSLCASLINLTYVKLPNGGIITFTLTGFHVGIIHIKLTCFVCFNGFSRREMSQFVLLKIDFIDFPISH